jgi:hypothetical protein
MSDKPELPPYDLADMGRKGGLYNEKTLRAYGAACAAAAMERAAVICNEHPLGWLATPDDWTKRVGNEIAAAIRAALQE